MKKFLLKILILSLIPLFVFAAPDKAQERIDYEVFKAKTETNIEALKTIKSQDLENFRSQVEAQKSLSEQLNHQVDWLGHQLTIGSAIITGLLLLIGFFTYRNARSDAKEVAQTEAKAWLENNTIALNAEIETLRAKLKTLELEAKSHADATHEQLDRILSDVGERSINDSKPSITNEQANALNQKAEELKSTPEAMYKYKDWNTKAFASYHQGDFLDAAKFWGLAAASADAKENEISKTLFNKATVELTNLNQPAAAIVTYDSLIQKFGDSQHAEMQAQLARAYVNKGFTQGDKLNQPAAEIATYDTVIQKFGDSQHAEVQTQVARAYVNKGFTQGDKLNQPAAALATYDSLIQKFGDSQHAEVQAQVARAYLNKGVTQGDKLNQQDAEIATYDSLIQKFGDSQNVEMQAQLAMAYFNKGFTQGDKLNQPAAEIATYDSLIEKFGDSQHAEVQAQVTRAYVNKGATQGDKLNQPAAEIATYDSVIEKFGDSRHAEVQAQVARAYVNKGATQGDKLNQPDAVIATYDSLIEKFGNSEHVVVQEQLARSYNSLGFANLIEAKKNWKVKSKRDALLSKAASSFSNAIDKCNANDKATILGNIAYTAWLLGDRTNTKQQLKEALKIGGEELYRGTIGDTEIETVSSDKAFRVLLDKIWAEVSTSK
ncbi:hypothetical protein [Methylophilus sp.]|uniref:hypothetical protein n=1 Tax=Methylophilus sp. TaxID=29541 RepID=UPI00403800F9